MGGMEVILLVNFKVGQQVYTPILDPEGETLLA